MNQLKLGLFLVLHLLIIVCSADDSFLKHLAESVEKLERRELESERRQQELEDKVSLYTDLTEKLRTELEEKGRVIDEMKQQIDDFEEMVRKLQTKRQQDTIEPDAIADNSTVNKENIYSPETNFSRTLQREGQRVQNSSKRRHVSSISDNKQDSGTRISSSKRRFVDQGENVAFHAVNTQAEIAHIGIGQNILFETVMLNLNSGFHPQHGVFIAPTAGLYIFSTSILSYNGQTTTLFAAELVKNGVVLGQVYGHGELGYHDQGSVTAVTQLAAGDEVWVKLSCCADDSLYGGYYTTFTGALLNAL